MPDLRIPDLRIPDVHIAVLHTVQEVEQLVPEWRTLWQSDAKATPFQSPELLMPWLHAFGHRDVRVITIRYSGVLVGLLPLYIYADPHSGSRQLLFIGAGTSDYLDGVFSHTCGHEDIGRAIDMALQEPGWDELCLTQLRADSLLLQIRSKESRLFAEACSRTRAVRLSELPGKLRANVRYYRNRAERSGPLQLTFATEHNCTVVFETLRCLHTERWQQQGLPGVLADDRVLAWHREALPQLARAGLLRLSSLTLAGETIAVLYCLIDPPGRPQRTVYFYLPGIDMQHSQIRPGTLLQALTMDAVAEEGAIWFDFLRGDESYKKIWHAEPIPTFALVERAGQSQWENAA